jgi:nudix-type nucleoside diphosphatase (YffH/AdpP family)
VTERKVTGDLVVETKTAYAGWAKFLVLTLQLPDGSRVKREVEDHGDAVCILPYHPERKTAVMVRQLRAPVLYAAKMDETIEAIAGGIEQEEDAATCVRREAMEEAQLTVGSLEHLFTAWTMPGVSTERMHFYLGIYSGGVRGEVRGGAAGEDESTIAFEVGLTELARMADGGELNDVKALLLVQTLRLRRPELF